ncbi:DUF2783 domain-containing protein [Thalassococcus sp. CAU 1522]|uniref:DUF2783 domain-containing protein n=1 Tax=Thalassococcus arenae TaxID=2851652 RepID=A0ABS6N6V8_9RHOB|nr:DUF2783 domain-containing protein [Thalassococcus arenae]MBV2359741.1 DUF2783 domain-containing protein [Thalassococcus arenae]
MTQDDRLGADGDAIYAALVAAHAGLDEAASHRLNARLVLMLANHIGQASDVLRLIADAKAYDEVAE